MNQRSSGELGYFGVDGKTQKIDLSQFEKEVSQRKLEDLPEDRSDELHLIGPGGAVGTPAAEEDSVLLKAGEEA
jgi:hypothetical protein